MAALMETTDGQRHMVSPIGGSEHTLCGIAIDSYLSENEPNWESVPLTGSKVTCELCSEVVLACRGVSVRNGPVA